MSTYHWRNSDCKEFADNFNILCNSRPRWQVWSDFVHMAAYAISNACDTYHKESREAAYLTISKKYSKAEMETVSRLLAITVTALEKNPDQDFLGELYMRLELGNSHAGQFFTPYDISRMMAEMYADDVPSKIDEKGYISVSDCCIGGGAMLVAFANALRMHNVYYHDCVMFVGQDIDHTVAMMAYIQLSLLGCPGYVVVGNSLTEPLENNVLFAPMDREVFITPFYFTQVWETRRYLHIIDATLKEIDVESELNDVNIEPQESCAKAEMSVATQKEYTNSHSDIEVMRSEDNPNEVVQLTFYDL